MAELCDIAANINIIPSLSPSHFKIKRLRKLFYLDAGLYNGLAGKRFPHNKEKYCKIEKNFFLIYPSGCWKRASTLFLMYCRPCVRFNCSIL